MRLYEMTARVPRPDRKGKMNMVNETWLVDAMTFTETEMKAKTIIEGVTDIPAIRRTSYSDIIGESDSAERWYKAKVNFIDEEEKKTPRFYIVAANSVDDAHVLVENYLKDTVSDTEIDSIDSTKIAGIIR